MRDVFIAVTFQGEWVLRYLARTSCINPVYGKANKMLQNSGAGIIRKVNRIGLRIC